MSPNEWDMSLAQRIGRSEEMGEIDESQKELLLTLPLRAEFQKFSTVMALSHICHLNGLDADCLHQLFCPPLGMAYRGSANPGEEAKAYLA